MGSPVGAILGTHIQVSPYEDANGQLWLFSRYDVSNTLAFGHAVHAAGSGSIALGHSAQVQASQQSTSSFSLGSSKQLQNSNKKS